QAIADVVAVRLYVIDHAIAVVVFAVAGGLDAERAGARFDVGAFGGIRWFRVGRGKCRRRGRLARRGLIWLRARWRLTRTRFIGGRRRFVGGRRRARIGARRLRAV